MEPLSEEHQRWVHAIEADHELPVGYAEALVRKYIEDPAFFRRENIESLRATPPKLDEKPMSLDVVTGADAEALAEQYKPAIAELIPMEDSSCPADTILRLPESPTSSSETPQIPDTPQTS